MIPAFSQPAISYRFLFVIPVAAALGMAVLIRAMRRLALRRQFMLLAVLGIAIGFIFLVLVQVPDFPQWLGVALLAIVFTASFFGVRIFLRSMAQEEKDEHKTRAEDARNAREFEPRNMKPTNHTL